MAATSTTTALGWDVTADLSSTSNQTGFTNINVSGGTTFSGDATDGIYAEKLDHATFNGIQLVGSGYSAASSNPYGINLNLKKGTYSNITIENAILTNNGLGNATLNNPGTGLNIDPDNTKYGPVSLSTVVLTNVNVAGSPIDLAIRDNVTGVSMSGVQLSGAGLGLLYAVTAPGGLNLGDTSFSTTSGFVFNATPFAIDATGASFNGFIAGAGDPTNATDLAEYYGVEDNIVDGVDIDGAGLVRLKAGYVFVSNGSTVPANLSGFVSAATIQPGVDAATSGDTVEVQGGTYVGQVIISKDLTLLGAAHRPSSRPLPRWRLASRPLRRTTRSSACLAAWPTAFRRMSRI